MSSTSEEVIESEVEGERDAGEEEEWREREQDYSLQSTERTSFVNDGRQAKRRKQASLCSNEDETREEKRRNAMRLKWLTVTGQKPFNFPVTRIYRPTDTVEEVKYSYYGERRPQKIAEVNKQKWLELARTYKSELAFLNEGRVLKELRLPLSHKGMCCLRYSPSGDTMVTSSGNGLVQLRHPKTGTLEAVLKPYDGFPVRALRYHPLHVKVVFAGSTNGFLYLMKTDTKEMILKVNTDVEVNSLDVSCDGSKLSTGSKDGTIRIYDSNTIQCLTMFKRSSLDTVADHNEDKYHKHNILSLKFHPTEESIFVSGGWDKTVKVWDSRVNTGAVLNINGPFICGDAIDVRENEILTGSWIMEHGLALWDIRTGGLLRQIIAKNTSPVLQGDFFYSAQFFKASKNDSTSYRDLVAVGGNGHDRVEVINIESQMIIARFPAMKPVVSLDSFNGLIAFGGTESLFRIGEVLVTQKNRKIAL